MSKSLKELAPSTEEQVESLRASNTLLRNEVSGLRKQIGDWQEFSAQVVMAVKALQPLPKMVWSKRSRKDKPIVEPAFKLSDWHIGEVTSASETEGFGEFDSSVAQRRLDAMTDSWMAWVETNRADYEMPRCTLLMEGDYVSGDIHDELLRTNEFPLPVQTAKAGLLMAQVIRKIASAFERTQIVCVGGDNHGRLTRKPQAKQRATNNMSYLVYALAQEGCRGVEGLEWVMADGLTVMATIGGRKFLCEHGDGVRGWAGTPYYGMARKLGKEAKRRMMNGKGFDLWSIGHFHCPAVVEGNILVNGSLSGTSEFDHACGRHAEPAQVGFMVGKHGIFNWTPFGG